MWNVAKQEASDPKQKCEKSVVFVAAAAGNGKKI